MPVQNRIFTAKKQRTQRSHFLFGGERPPNKSALEQDEMYPLQCYSAVSMPSPSLKGFALWPNRLSRLGHKQKIPLRPLRLCGEPDFETKQIHPKTPMKSRNLTSDFSYPGQQ
jgi:hypothetical protein